MEPIILYPSNWLYNAGVIGFLKVIACGKDENVIEGWLNDNGTVTIDSNAIKFLSEIYNVNDKTGLGCLNNWVIKYIALSNGGGIFNEDIFRVMSNKFFGQKSLYSNLVSPRPKKDKSIGQYTDSERKTLNSSIKSFNKKIEWLYYKPPSKKTVEVCCSFCNELFLINKGDLLDFSFQNRFCALLGGSAGEFPNTFWGNVPNMFICPRCAFQVIHHHIPFDNTRTKDGQIFINAPSFKIMWHLNKFAEQMLSRNKSYQVREILGISFMELAQKVFVTLGAWSMMNIEMVIKRGNEIEYYSLPHEISRVLLQKEIASLISATKEPLILETVLDGNFDYLLTLSHKVLRYSVTGSNAFNDKYLSQLRNRDTYSLKNLSKILPELYVKINSTINREVMI